MGKSLSFGILVLSLLVFASCQSQQKEIVQKIDKTELKKTVIGKQVQFIDVRTPGEYANGHIDDAINMDINDPNFIDQILRLDKDKPVYLYCKKGARSNRAATLLKERGFTKIFDYAGGYDDWISNLP